MNIKTITDLVYCDESTGALIWKTTRRGRNGKSNAGERAAGFLECR